MSYRNITVNGRVYQYSIGRKATHIRSVGTFAHASIGDMIVGTNDPDTGCYKFIVTPRCVANAIKGIHAHVLLGYNKDRKLVPYASGESVHIPDLSA